MALPTRVDAFRAQLERALLAPSDALAISVHGLTEAAVLVPLYLNRGEVQVVFTKRHEELRRHAGEISFPGGRREEGEPDLRATALREAHEEIGLPVEAVEIVGALQPTATLATGYAVYPFVGLIEPGRDWVPNVAEVSAVIELSVAQLSSGYGRRRLMRRGIPIRTDAYVVGDHLIWGATARILADLLDRLEAIGR